MAAPDPTRTPHVPPDRAGDGPPRVTFPPPDAPFPAGDNFSVVGRVRSSPRTLARGIGRMRRRVEREPDRPAARPDPGRRRPEPRVSASPTPATPPAPAHLGNPQVTAPPDLDAAERLVAPVLARTAGTGRARTTGVRDVLAAVAWKLRTGRGWRDLPADFPPWQTCYGEWRRFVAAGLGAELRRLLDPR